MDDTYPAESSHAGSMDRSTLRGEIAPQPSVCVFCVFSPSVCVLVCVRVLVYLSIVHLAQPTAAPMTKISQYGETLYVQVCVRFCKEKERFEDGVSDALLFSEQ